jgi:hypothetical protein
MRCLAHFSRMSLRLRASKVVVAFSAWRSSSASWQLFVGRLHLLWATREFVFVLLTIAFAVLMFKLALGK